MQDDMIKKITDSPTYHKLVTTRSTYAWIMTILVMVAYYGFILLVAFDKELLASKIGAGVTSLGVPLGLGVIVFTILVTNIYVRRANSEFDDMTAQIVKEAKQ
ncbi:MAG: DUF485 domain-containing protein [Rhodocyclaceae bacterium]|nr:DUF485 domain-containing protein [Rhodocyclaceae bacterium]